MVLRYCLELSTKLLTEGTNYSLYRNFLLKELLAPWEPLGLFSTVYGSYHVTPAWSRP
jgi:hypothetical protein